jgi:ribosomal protein S10
MPIKIITVAEIQIRLISDNCKKLNIASFILQNLVSKSIEKSKGIYIETIQISLPIKVRRWCLLKSPHIDKKAREHFCCSKYTRLHIIKVENEIFNFPTADYFGFELDGSFPNGVRASCNFIREYYPYNLYQNPVTSKYLIKKKSAC